jgi:hypothetical protein
VRVEGRWPSRAASASVSRDSVLHPLGMVVPLTEGILCDRRGSAPRAVGPHDPQRRLLACRGQPGRLAHQDEVHPRQAEQRMRRGPSRSETARETRASRRLSCRT